MQGGSLLRAESREDPSRGARDRGLLIAQILTQAWLPDPPPPDITPEQLHAVASLLHRQGSSGLAWHRIRSSPLGDHPDASLLQDGSRYHTLRVRALEGQLAQVWGFLEDQGIQAILAKGWSVGRLYPESGLRPYGDLDLMIAPGLLEAASRTWATEAPPAPVELHPHFDMLRDRTREELFERSRRVTLAERSIRILGAEDELRLVCLHGFNHGLWRPLWLCDVAILLASAPSDFDWTHATKGDPWLSDGVRCSLGLARDLLGVNLEAHGVPDPWNKPDLPSWLRPAALRAFGAREHYLHMEHPGNLLARPRALLRSARLRWSNPIEVTYRRSAPWDDGARLPYQVLDYGLRAGGLLFRSPGYLREMFGEREARDA